MNKLLGVIQKVRNFVDPIVNVLESVLGTNSLVTLINCKFIGVNVVNLTNTFGGIVSQSAYTLGVLLCLIACINVIIVILTIIFINNILDGPSNNQVIELSSEEKPLTKRSSAKNEK